SVYTFKHNFKLRLKTFAKDALLFLKTRPKEFTIYSLVMLKLLIKKSGTPFSMFKAASLVQKIAALALVAVVLLSGWVLLNNMKGVWLPHINEPLLTSLA